MYYMLAACMAGPLVTGQEIATHLLLHIILLLISHLVYLVLPKDPMSFLLLGQDNRSDVGMATLGASSQCLFQQKIQVFQEAEEENG